MRKFYKLISEDKRPMRSLNRRYVRENNEYTVRPKTKKELKYIIEKAIEEQGNNADLNFIVTGILYMNVMFCNSSLEDRYGKNGENLKSDVTESYSRRR